MKIKVEGVRVGSVDVDAWRALKLADEADPDLRHVVSVNVSGYPVVIGQVVEVALVDDALVIDVDPLP